MLQPLLKNRIFKYYLKILCNLYNNNNNNNNNNDNDNKHIYSNSLFSYI